MEHEMVAGPGLRELFALFNLLIVGGILYFAGRRGIAAMVRTRSEEISKKIVDARKELERMAAETARARKEISNIESAKSRFISEVRTEGERLHASLVEEARRTADRILADAKLAADNEVRLAANRLREQVVTEALGQAAQLVSDPKGTELRNQMHEKLVEGLVGDFPGSNPGRA